MNLVDVHAHFDLGEYDQDIKEVLEGCKKANVKAVVINGVHPESNRKVLKLSKEHPLLKPALGYYPTHIVEDKWEKIEEELDFILKNREKVALGEVGLDYKETTDEAGKKKQREAFEKIIKISEKTKKPLIIHSRKAEEDVISMLESSTLKNPVMHCFMGKTKLWQKAADNGYNFSIPVIVNKLQQFQELVKYANINQILTETDSPYLAPVQGERNTPANVAIAIKKIAEIKGFTEEETANTIFMNYQRLFL